MTSPHQRITLFNTHQGRIQDFKKEGADCMAVDERSRSDRARPQAVLGVGAGGGRPLPRGGPGVSPPGKFLGSCMSVGEF